MILAIFRENFPIISFEKEVTNSKLETFWSMALVNEVLFAGGSLTSGTAAWLVKTTRYMNNTENTDFKIGDVTELFSVDGTYSLVEWSSAMMINQNFVTAGSESIAITNKTVLVNKAAYGWNSTLAFKFRPTSNLYAFESNIYSYITPSIVCSLDTEVTTSNELRSAKIMDFESWVNLMDDGVRPTKI